MLAEFRNKINAVVARVVLFSFFIFNVSPVFGDLAEYEVTIQKSHQIQEDGVQADGFLVEARKLATPEAPMGELSDGIELVYETILSKFITPFMSNIVPDVSNLSGQTTISEVLEKVNAVIKPSSKESEQEDAAGKDGEDLSVVESTENDELESKQDLEVNTDVSSGFCLDLPEVGSLLISHDGDVIFNGTKDIQKSIKISGPSKIILNNMHAKDVELEGAAAILCNKNSAQFESLKFKSISNTELIENSLIIGQEASLEVKKLQIENALLLNAGILNIVDYMDLNGGCFINAGEVRTSANPACIENMSYMLNSSGSSIQGGDKLTIAGDHITNIGTIQAKTMSVVSSGIFDNKGAISTSVSFDLQNLGGEAINNGSINGNGGEVTIGGDIFEQKQGELIGNKIKFVTDSAILSGKLTGVEGFFSGNTIASGDVSLHRGVINGAFTNLSSLRFEDIVELVGDTTKINNKGEMSAPKLLSQAKKGVIYGGCINATSALIDGHLEIDSHADSLQNVNVKKGGTFRISDNASVEKLSIIDNDGTVQLSPSKGMPKIVDVAGNRGKLIVGTNLPNLVNLKINRGSTFFATDASDLSNLKTITNDGFAYFKSKLLNLDTVSNLSKAELHLIDRVEIEHSLQNDGKMLISSKSQKTPNVEKSEHIDLVNLRVKNGAYSASESGILEFKNGARVRCLDFINDGIFCTSSSFTVTQFGNVTKWGRMVCEDGITYEIKNVGNSTFDLGNVNLFPLIKKDSGQFVINGNGKNFTLSKKIEYPINVSITGYSLNIPSNMALSCDKFNGTFTNFSNAGKIRATDCNLKTSSFSNSGIVEVNDFKLSTSSFSNQTGIIKSRNSVNIDSSYFRNGMREYYACRTLTKPKTYGLRQVDIKKATYYGQSCYRTSVDQYKILMDGYYTDPVNRYTIEYYPELHGKYYSCELYEIPGGESLGSFYNRASNAGYISTGGNLSIIASDLDNTFGYLYAKGQISLNGSSVKNEGGVIYSKCGVNISGSNLYNGSFVKKEFPSYDPCGEVKEYKIVKKTERYSGFFGARRLFSGRPRRIRRDGNSFDEIRDYVTIDYRAKTEYANLCNPGFIYIENAYGSGDLNLCISGIDYGEIIANGNIRSYGSIINDSIKKNTDGKIIARGNVSLYLAGLYFTRKLIEGANITISVHNEVNTDGYHYVRDVVDPFIVKFSNFVKSNRAIVDEVEERGSATRYVPAFGMPKIMKMVDPVVSASTFPGKIISKVNSGAREVRVSASPELLESFVRMTAGVHMGRSALMYDSLCTYLHNQAEIYLRNYAIAGTHDLFKFGASMLCYTASDDVQAAEVVDEQSGEVVNRGQMQWLDPTLVVFPKKFEDGLYADSCVDILCDKSATFSGNYQDVIKASKLRLMSKERMSIGNGEIMSHEPVEVPAVSSKFDSIEISGDKGLTVSQDLNLRDSILLRSKDGDIALNGKVFRDTRDMDIHRGHYHSSTDFVRNMNLGAKEIVVLAPHGKVEQTGVDVNCDKFYVEGRKSYTVRSIKAVREMEMSRQGRHSMEASSYQELYPGSKINASQFMTIVSDDARIAGAEIVTKDFLDDTRSLQLVAEKGVARSKTSQKKSTFWGKSRSQTNDMVETAQLAKLYCDRFQSKRGGVLGIESLIGQIGEFVTNKDIRSSSVKLREHHESYSSGSGFFAPKLRADPIIDAIKSCNRHGGLVSMVKLGSSAVQLGSHLQVLSTLGSVQDPTTVFLNILGARYVAGPSFVHTKSTHVSKTSTPLPSNIEIGVLNVKNDSTVIEGNWKVGDGFIDTKKLVVKASQGSEYRYSNTEGFSVMFGFTPFMPLILANPGIGMAAGMLPMVDIQNSEGERFAKTYIPSTLTADRLVIRADDVVYSGSQIRAKIVDAIITGSLTIESLKGVFKEHSSSKGFGTCLSSVFNTVSGQTSGLSALSGFPSIRIAKRDLIEENLDALASFVGEEEFYLKVGGDLINRGAVVGLVPDGKLVSNGLSASEKIEAGKVFESQVNLESKDSRRTFDTTLLSAFGQLASNVDEFMQIRRQIAQEESKRGVPLAERVKIDREVKEFLDKPEVKADYVQLKQAQDKQRQACLAASKIEDSDPVLTMEAVSDLAVDASIVSASDAKSSGAYAKSEDTLLAGLSSEEATSARRAEYFKARAEQNAAGRDVLRIATSLRVKVDEFAKSHPILLSCGSALLESVGYAAVLGTIYSAVPSIGGMFVAGGSVVGFEYAIANVIEYGAEPFVESAASYAISEPEAREFANTALWTIKTLLNCVAVAGVLKVARKFDVISKQLALLEADLSKIGLAAYRRAQNAFAKTDAVSARGILTSLEARPEFVSAKFRLDTISELEKISYAAKLPGEWNGQFKLIQEIPSVAGDMKFASNVYCRQVLFKDPKTGQMFRAFQRNDIDPNYVVKSGKDVGRANFSLMKEGRAPYTLFDEPVIVHHLGQSAYGPFVEVTKRTHKSFLHNQFGYGKPHPSAPVIRAEFDCIRQAYWMCYAKSFK